MKNHITSIPYYRKEIEVLSIFKKWPKKDNDPQLVQASSLKSTHSHIIMEWIEMLSILKC